MINLTQLLEIKEQEFQDYKVHFAIGRDNRKEPYNTFLIDGFKNWQEHEDLEASSVTRKPKWNIKYLKSRSDLINAFSSNPAFKLSHSMEEMDLK